MGAVELYAHAPRSVPVNESFRLVCFIVFYFFSLSVCARAFLAAFATTVRPKGREKSMRGAEKAFLQEQEHVVYTGAVLVPFCVGSVTLPLSLFHKASQTSAACIPPNATSTVVTPTRDSVRQRKRQTAGKKQQPVKRERGDGSDAHDYNTGISRCTHLRYSYLRDGASASQDLAYRHLWLLNSNETSFSHEAVVDNEVVRGASPLYALVDRVIFKLPSSFPEPHRELTQPPFFVVDDTWAEHVVEIEVHFRPWLGIAPFTVTHMVPLQRRADLTPQLLSSTFGQARAPPTIILPSLPVTKATGSSSTATHSHQKCPSARKTAARSSREKKEMEEKKSRMGSSRNSKMEKNDDSGSSYVEDTEEGITTTRDACIYLEDLEEAPIVAERRDAIRIFHPTLRIVRYLAAVRAMPSPPPEIPPSFCIFPGRGSESTHVRMEERRGNDRDSNRIVVHDEEDTLPSWCFPFEPIMHAHEPKRQEGAVLAMRAVLDALQKEQAELQEGIDQKIHSATVNAQELRSVIQHMRETCVLLQKVEKH